MTYHYQEKHGRWVFALGAICLDTFFIAWVLMKIWNETMTDVFDVKRLTYTNAILLRFGYSALTTSSFTTAYFINSNEKRFDDYANMISTRFTTLIDGSNTRV